MTGQPPTVSIVTPSFNQGRFIERTLRSVLLQDYSRLEYIVVDGGSTDGTAKVLERYRPFIDRLVVEPDSGQANALNKGFGLATGAILAFLNSDDCYAAPDVVARVAGLLSSGEHDLVSGRRMFVSEEGKFLQSTPFRPFSRDHLLLCDFLPQECTFFTREIFERAGSYLDETFDFALDYELWLRMLARGARFLCIEPYVGLFRWYAEQKTNLNWKTVGLEEIARLHERHLGRRIDEAEMFDHYNTHFFRAHPRRELRGYLFVKEVWDLLMAHTAKSLAGRLDDWVFSDPDPWARRLEERRRRAPVSMESP
jgi:glycosyltransferase involved in cell wall biosynthesis